jgi:hypothetical protein
MPCGKLTAKSEENEIRHCGFSRSIDASDNVEPKVEALVIDPLPILSNHQTG